MGNIGVNTVNFVLELSITFCLLVVISRSQSTSVPLPRRIVAILCLAGGLLPLFYLVSDASLAQYIRVPYRLAVYAVFLFLWGKCTLRYVLYYAAIAATLHSAFINIWTTPVLYSITDSMLNISTADPFRSLFVLCIGKYLLYGLMSVFFLQLFPYKKVEHVGRSQGISVAVAFVCELYVKESLFYINKTGPQANSISIYIVLFSLLVLVFLIIEERNSINIARKNALKLEMVANEYRLKSAKSHQEGVESVRILYHDIKNHLLALEKLAEGDGRQAIRDYIQELGAKAVRFEKCYFTGNDLLDGILSEKRSEAEARRVTYTAEVRFGGGSPSATQIFARFSETLSTTAFMPPAWSSLRVAGT